MSVFVFILYCNKSLTLEIQGPLQNILCR